MRAVLLLVCLLFTWPSGLLVAQNRARPTYSLESTLRYYQRCKDRDESGRVRAVRSLGEHADERATRILLAELDRATTPWFRRIVVQALGRRPRPAAVPVLAGLLEKAANDYRLRDAICHALATQGERGVDALLEALDTLPARLEGPARSYMRRSLFAGLARAGTPRAVERLCREATEGETNRRVEALRAMHDLPDSPAVREVRKRALGERDPDLAVEALRQLTRHGPADPALVERALALHRRTRTKASGRARAALLEAFASLLEDRTYAAFVELAAAADPEVDHTLAQARERVVGDAGFAKWLLTKGLALPDPVQRGVVIRLLAGMSGSEITEALLRLSRAKEAAVARAAIRALARREDPAVARRLAELAAKGPEALREEAFVALHRQRKDDPAWRDELRRMARSANAARRTLALDLLAELGDTEILERVWKDFTHRAWPVRAAAYDYCRKVRDARSVPRLIERLDQEEGRLREDVLDALQALTGLRFASAERWRRWWRESGANFALRPPPEEDEVTRRRSGGTTITYYDLPVVSRRVAFVVDHSGSMSQPMGTGGVTRLETAKRQLRDVVRRLTSEHRFELIFFASRVKPVFGRLTKADAKAKKKAAAAVDALRARGGTNIHDALARAFEDPDVDTIYLLSDGYPSAGRVRDPEALAAAVERWNRTRRIRIHTIAVGSTSPLLERLARSSGGRTIHVR